VSHIHIALLIFYFIQLFRAERAFKLISECETITLKSIFENIYPDINNPWGHVLGKYLNLIVNGTYSYESLVDDFVFQLMGILGFNDGNLLVLYELEFFQVHLLVVWVYFL
jgi:hypothetical protein